MGFDASHAAALAALKIEVEKVTELQSVTIGELETVPPDKYPVCFIVTKRIPRNWATGNEVLHRIRIWIIVVNRGPISTTAYEESIELEGKVFEKVKAKLDLDGTVEGIDFGEAVFEYRIGKDINFNWSITEIDIKIEE